MPIGNSVNSLINKSVSSKLAQTVFSESHGAFDDHLGAGLLYYALAAMNRSQVSVCIGSGGGFVPRLLRRAQEDLGLEEAHTYLIDANLPDLGFGHPMQEGGWLTADNDLQTATPGLTILRMLSRDAAQLFAAKGITIDYLHIDGDHSARGVIADVTDYLPILSPRAIVSLHDLRLDCVQQAMIEIGGRFPALEWITFAEVGNGTAILRRRTALPPPLPLSLNPAQLPKRIIRLDDATVAQETEHSQARARYERWHYLKTPAYQSRYDLISHSIDAPDRTIIELGGYPNSIVRHLALARRVIAIEPYAPREYLDEVQAIAEQRGINLLVKHGVLGQADLDTALLGRYALVALGLDPSAGCDSAKEFHAALGSLIDLAEHAEIIGIEVPGYAPSQLVLQCLLECIEPIGVHDILLDLSHDPVAKEFYVHDDRARRRVLVFRPGRSLRPEQREPVLAKFAARFGDIRIGLPERTKTYNFDDTVHFRKEAAAERYLTRGWSGVEPRHVWCVGSKSELELEITGLPDKVRSFLLRLDLVALVQPEKIPHQRLAVLTNGKRVFKGRIHSGGFLEIPITREILVARNPVRIALIHPDGVKPAERLVNSKDTRILSIGLRSIALVRRAETGDVQVAS